MVVSRRARQPWVRVTLRLPVRQALLIRRLARPEERTEIEMIRGLLNTGLLLHTVNFLVVRQLLQGQKGIRFDAETNVGGTPE